MKIKILMVLGIVLILFAAGLTGCSTGVGAAEGQSVVNINSQQGIWVSGMGKVSVTPDTAVVTLGVSAQAATVADAQSQAAAAMDKVMKALTANGVDTKDIQTQYFSINPQYKFDNTTQQSTITGYQVSNIVTVKIRSIDKAGPIIDAVAAAGGDNTRINGISFSVDNPDPYYSQARTLAMNDAKAKAQSLAGLAGVTLGKATYITESSASQPVLLAPSVQPSVPGATPGTSISPGQTDITVNVQVAYAIQ